MFEFEELFPNESNHTVIINVEKFPSFIGYELEKNGTEFKMMLHKDTKGNLTKITFDMVKYDFGRREWNREIRITEDRKKDIHVFFNLDDANEFLEQIN